jgi:carbon monoxide dehydrogenase subunit G
VIIADKTFTVAGSRERIWECLTKALLRAIPFEQMEFADERKFSALLRLKIGCLSVPTKIKVEIANMVEPETLTTKIRLDGMKGIIRLDQIARFSLKPSDEATTEVAVNLEVENMSMPLRTFFLWKVRSFATDSLDSVERFLHDWV